MNALALVHDAQIINAPTLEAAVDRMAASLCKAKEGMLEAGKILAWMIDKYGRSEVNTIIRKKVPSLTTASVRKLELYGRGACDPRIMFSGTQAAFRLSYVPLAEQVSALDEGIEYLTPSGDVVRLAPDDMTKEQVAQAIVGNKIRSVGEQRAYLAQAPKEDKPKGKAYAKDGKVYVTKACTLSRFEIAQLLAQMGE